MLKKWISTVKKKKYNIWIILFFLLFGVLFIWYQKAGKSEKEQLIERILISKEKTVFDYKPNFFEGILDDVREPGYWSKEYVKSLNKLISKGYFTKKEINVSTSKLKKHWDKLWDKEKEKELILCSYIKMDHPKGRSVIVLIGPPSLVIHKEEAINKMLNTITQSQTK